WPLRVACQPGKYESLTTNRPGPGASKMVRRPFGRYELREIGKTSDAPGPGDPVSPEPWPAPPTASPRSASTVTTPSTERGAARGEARVVAALPSRTRVVKIAFGWAVGDSRIVTASSS